MKSVRTWEVTSSFLMEIYICVGGIQRIEIFLLSNFSGHIVSFYRESIICIFIGVVIENHLHENEGVAQIFFYKHTPQSSY